jgi:hypothetical protein
MSRHAMAPPEPAAVSRLRVRAGIGDRCVAGWVREGAWWVDATSRVPSRQRPPEPLSPAELAVFGESAPLRVAS